MKKIFCDLCKKEITGDVNKVGFGIVEGDHIINNSRFESIETDLDFCSVCIEKVAASIMVVVKPQLEEDEENPVPVEDPKPAKEKPKRTKIDKAKVWSLYDAGWGVPDIAHEFYCSAQAIYNILNKERPKMEVAYDSNVNA